MGKLLLRRRPAGLDSFSFGWQETKHCEKRSRATKARRYGGGGCVSAENPGRLPARPLPACLPARLTTTTDGTRRVLRVSGRAVQCLECSIRWDFLGCLDLSGFAS